MANCRRNRRLANCPCGVKPRQNPHLRGGPATDATGNPGRKSRGPPAPPRRAHATAASERSPAGARVDDCAGRAGATLGPPRRSPGNRHCPSRCDLRLQVAKGAPRRPRAIWTAYVARIQHRHAPCEPFRDAGMADCVCDHRRTRRVLVARIWLAQELLSDESLALGDSRVTPVPSDGANRPRRGSDPRNSTNPPQRNLAVEELP